jgi:hypothetical protein
MRDDECATVEPPGVASCSRHGPWRSGVDVDVVDADVVYTDEDTAESVELKLEGVDDVETK